ncbi:MAG: DCC1-like thiol-disulfide oxidoreductase family protein [Armatimonadota bacterium]|nr:DCC1-like thiol-disulfide oxidoreductase family protein [Armatimonadota bacterium]MDR7487946.1 DCC1-like thiol-disulfide oxidoreductase family protein [Armatimonadota bacterium]MDR7528378.1 DCC1-like thiol-disulfide oxidoreductase family protein [Armatimonadota bacterium]MDR7574522.1 DCC1-like thiol-disulfide oxidoreductase family protein [Armatimonadota bacterium]MDR7584369.1 DCC1-like thiol-disulfide oxidoreductase family protein [Armatimonadota bacterium]
MRIALGGWAVFFYLLYWPERHLLWGPDGFLPFETFLTMRPVANLYALHPSPLYFEVVYHLGLLLAVAFLLGYRTRLATAGHWLALWSLQERNPLVGDGGDNIMRIVLLFFVLVNSAAFASVDALPRKPRASPWASLGTALREPLAVAHNFGVLLILAQLAMLYASTGLYKVMGELWQNGTALYYILRVDEFSWPGRAEFIYRNPYLVVLGTYGTVLFEVFFAPALANRWTRYAVIGMGTGFHLGIAAFMGLVTFAWSMLAIYPLLLTDEEYRGMAAWWRRRWRLTVFYDGWCGLCRRSVAWLTWVDVAGLIRFRSFREPSLMLPPGIDLARAERRIQSLDGRGRVREGTGALIAILIRIPLLWPLVPVLLVLRMTLGERAYDVVATRRFRFFPACAGECKVRR